jgi:pyridoxine 5-phosphate synthase
MAHNSVRLGVNIDHIATIRNARGGTQPDPILGAWEAIKSGADGITAHLREDRRHINDDDLNRLQMLCSSENIPLNMEMAATKEMLDIALTLKPKSICIVPERRQERTTEGGLNVQSKFDVLSPIVYELNKNGSRVSLFIEAKDEQITAASQTDAKVVEFHTGSYAKAVEVGDAELIDNSITEFKKAALLANQLGLEVHFGHGLNYDNVEMIAAIPQCTELNIGHFIIGEAIFSGLGTAITEMRTLVENARIGL